MFSDLERVLHSLSWRPIAGELFKLENRLLIYNVNAVDNGPGIPCRFSKTFDLLEKRSFGWVVRNLSSLVTKS